MRDTAASEMTIVRPDNLAVLMGLPRSGTTIISRVLAAHSKIKALVEPYHAKGKDGYSTTDLDAFMSDNGNIERGQSLFVKETTTRIENVQLSLALLANAAACDVRSVAIAALRSPIETYFSEIEAAKSLWKTPPHRRPEYGEAGLYGYAHNRLLGLYRFIKEAARYDRRVVLYERFVLVPEEEIRRLMSAFPYEFERNQLDLRQERRRAGDPTAWSSTGVTAPSSEERSAKIEKFRHDFENVRVARPMILLHEAISDWVKTGRCDDEELWNETERLLRTELARSPVSVSMNKRLQVVSAPTDEIRTDLAEKRSESKTAWTDWSEVDKYLRGPFARIEGRCVPHLWQSIQPLRAAMMAQCGLGPVAEIGVHRGKFFIGLVKTMGAAQHNTAIDVFDRLDPDRGAGEGNLEALKSHLAECGVAASAVDIVRADSLSLGRPAIEELRKKTGGFAMFSVGGGHPEKYTINLVNGAMELMRPEGIIFVNDYYNPNRPGVQEGVAKLYFGGEPMFVPLLYTCNKLFLCNLSFHKQYLKAVETFLRENFPSTQIRVVRRFGYDTLTVAPSQQSADYLKWEFPTPSGQTL